MPTSRLSGFAYFPPVETTIVPRTETSLLTGNSPRYRRRIRSKLSPHFGLVYPLPPASPEVVTRERPRLAAVRTSLLGQRRKAEVLLLKHHFLVYPLPSALPPVADILNGKVVAVRAARTTQRREPLSVLRPHVGIVYPPPAVAVVYAPVSVHLARLPRRTVMQPRFSRPQVVSAAVLSAMGGTMTVVTQPRRQAILSSTLRPPVVVNP